MKMRTLAKISIVAFFILNMSLVNAQIYNWSSQNGENRHIATLNLGLENGVIYGLGYGYQFKTRSIPVIAAVEYSFPSGNDIFDDFKIKIGGQVRWVEFHNIQFSTRIYGVFRRYQNNFVRMANFGSDVAGMLGYYRPKWFVSGEVGFDKAIVTNFKHSDSYTEMYPTVANGWFGPSTGGNFYYGLQTGVSLGKNDINIRLGKVLTQDFKTTPNVPFYFQLGFNRKF